MSKKENMSQLQIGRYLTTNLTICFLFELSNPFHKTFYFILKIIKIVCMTGSTKKEGKLIHLKHPLKYFTIMQGGANSF